MAHSHLWRFVAQAIGFAILIAGLLVLIGFPVATVFQAAWAGQSSTEPGPSLATQKVSLAFQTVMLVLLTLAMALPIGVVTALVLFRTDVPGRTLWGLLMLLPALVPLDLHATAWLATLGPQGLAKWIGLPIELNGLAGAAWVHAMASISWVVALVGAASSIVESELEEDCLLLVGPLRTMWHVTVRRSAGAIVAAGLIVAVQTSGEMAITDLLQVRTYAETVYTEFAVHGRVGAATATAMPGLAVWLVLVALAVWLVVRNVPQDSQALFARRPLFRLGAGRWWCLAGSVLVVAATLGVPATSLVWRAGLHYPRRLPSANTADAVPRIAAPATPSHTQPAQPHWSFQTLRENTVRSARSAGDQLQLSLMVAAATAILCAPVAWLLVAIARSSRLGRWLVTGIACVLFALPGPVLGIGLKLATGRPGLWWRGDESILGVVAAWSDRLSDSPAVLVWLHCLRTVPYAIAVLWPVLRLVNRGLLEAAEIDGAGAFGRFWHVELPACRAGVVAAALVCAVLSVGELAGSVIVCPPGQQPLSVRIFSFAHYGMESHLAGICLLLLGVAAVGSLAVLLCLKWTVRSLRE